VISRFAGLLCVLFVSIGFAACGEGSATKAPEPQRDAGMGEPVHIHGLGLSPQDGTLFVATHSGLFEAPPRSARLRRIGETKQDIMGFAVADTVRLIGSGHPDPGDASLPPNVGLIESRDGGRSWESVSLLGEADFHVLRAAGARVYGFDGTRGRLMVSTDGGRRWTEHAPPAAVYDLAIDPSDPRRIIASTERGIFASADSGDTWRLVRNDTAGLLAWPVGDRLYLVDAGGSVQRSANAGRRWRTVGSIGDQPTALVADQSELIAAAHDGTVHRSVDGGRTWTLRAEPQTP
jgi:photosystem II stability/assembly factor-like uncharacterized protein